MEELSKEEVTYAQKRLVEVLNEEFNAIFNKLNEEKKDTFEKLLIGVEEHIVENNLPRKSKMDMVCLKIATLCEFLGLETEQIINKDRILSKIYSDIFCMRNASLN